MCQARYQRAKTYLILVLRINTRTTLSVLFATASHVSSMGPGTSQMLKKFFWMDKRTSWGLTIPVLQMRTFGIVNASLKYTQLVSGRVRIQTQVGLILKLLSATAPLPCCLQGHLVNFLSPSVVPDCVIPATKSCLFTSGGTPIYRNGWCGEAGVIH